MMAIGADRLSTGSGFVVVIVLIGFFLVVFLALILRALFFFL